MAPLGLKKCFMASAAIFVCNRELDLYGKDRPNEGLGRESGATFVLNRLLGKIVLVSAHTIELCIQA